MTALIALDSNLTQVLCLLITSGTTVVVAVIRVRRRNGTENGD